MNAPKRVAITGAGGFIGRRLVDRLVDAGHVVHAIVRAPEHVQAGAENHLVPSLSDSRVAEVLADSDTLIHLAWATTPASSRAQPLLELENNLLPSLQLLKELQNAPVAQTVFVSSSGAVQRAEGIGTVPDGTPVPRSYYGAGKVSVEQFLLALGAQFGNSCTILRPTNLYGPEQPLVPGFGLIRTIVDCLMRDRPLTVWGDGSIEKDFLYLEDFVDLLLTLITTDASPASAIFEVGSGTSHSIAQTVEMLESISGRRLRQIREPARDIDPAAVRVDTSQVTELTGWRPVTPLQEGLEKVMDWAKRKYEV